MDKKTNTVVNIKKKNSVRLDVFELVYSWIGLVVLFPFILIIKKNKFLKENYLPLFKIIHKSFVRTTSQHFLAIWFPLIFISILGNIIDGYTMTFSIGTYIPLVVGTMLLPNAVIIYKRSSLLKRIGATKINTKNLIIAFLTYFFIVCIFSITFNVGVGILMFHNNTNGAGFSSFDMTNVNWKYYIIAIIMQIILAFSMGMIVASVAKNETSAVAISLLIVIPGAFLAGQFIPLEQVNKISALRYLGWFFPQKGPTVLANIAIHDRSNPFNFSDHYIVPNDVYIYLGYMQKHPQEFTKAIDAMLKDPAKLKQWLDSQRVIYVFVSENIIALVIPLVVSATTISISIKYFKWHSR